MRILHTADWHLGDRLGRIDRTSDLRRAVEHVAELCERERVDVLLVAGDLLSEVMAPADRQSTMAHLVETFRPFLNEGGTIVAITGNHDNEVFCRTLQDAFRLASPAPTQPGDALPTGRFHLATGPTFFRLADRSGQQVQFVGLPYPTGQRYLNESQQQPTSIDERHRALRDALTNRLTSIQRRLDPHLPSVLTAHLYVAGTALRGLFRLSEQEDVVFGEAALSSGWSYVALGHIHQPQALAGMPHVRYSGSLERLDMGECDDEKSVTLCEIGPQGLLTETQIIPVAATPLLSVIITDPQTELSQLAERYPNHAEALVKLDITYRPGEDNLPEILDELERIFPRWYVREFRAASLETRVIADEADGHTVLSTNTGGPAATVRAYLDRTLAIDDPDRDELLTLAESLLTDSE